MHAVPHRSTGVNMEPWGGRSRPGHWVLNLPAVAGLFEDLSIHRQHGAQDEEDARLDVDIE